MSPASASEPASWTGAAKVVGTFAVGTFAVDEVEDVSVCPPHAPSAVSRRTSACVDEAGVCAQKIRCFELDRPRFIFDRMLVAVGDTLPALA